MNQIYLVAAAFLLISMTLQISMTMSCNCDSQYVAKKVMGTVLAANKVVYTSVLVITRRDKHLLDNCGFFRQLMKDESDKFNFFRLTAGHFDSDALSKFQSSFPRAGRGFGHPVRLGQAAAALNVCTSSLNVDCESQI
jgi:hypothetical protein